MAVSVASVCRVCQPVSWLEPSALGVCEGTVASRAGLWLQNREFCANPGFATCSVTMAAFWVR